MRFGRGGKALRRAPRAYSLITGSVGVGVLVANDARCVITGSADARPVYENVSYVTGLAGARFQPRALCSIAGSAGASGASESVYSNGYIARRRVHLPVASGFTGASPLWFSETIPELAYSGFNGRVQSSSGHDIKFVTSAGSNIPYILEKYDAATGQVQAELRGTLTDTTFYLYYGKTGLTESEADPASASVDCIGKWHPSAGTDYTGLSRALTATSVTVTTLLGRYAGLYNGTTSQLASTSTTYIDGLGSIHIHATAQGSGGLIIAGPTSGAAFSLRTAATGTVGGAANVWQFVLTVNKTGGGTAFVRLEGPAGSATANAVVIDAIWSSGTLPSLYLDGVKVVPSWIGATDGGVNTANATVSGTLATTGASGLKIGQGTAAAWTGTIGPVEIRSTPATTLILPRYNNLFDPQAAYGVGGEDTIDVTNRAPVAVPEKVTTTPNTAVTVDVLANDIEPDDDTKTLSSVDTPTGGTVVIETGKAKFTPTGGFTGRASFFSTVSDGSKTSRGKTVVTVGSNAYDYQHAMPWLPALDSNIVVWNVPAEGGVNSDTGDPTKLLLVVLPDDFKPTKNVRVAGQNTGTPANPNYVGTLYRGVVIVGGRMVLYGQNYSIPQNSDVAPAYPNGFPGGSFFNIRFKETGWGTVRPFVWVSNLELDVVDDNGVRRSFWGDIFRISTISTTANGTNHANFPTIYFQKFAFRNGHYGWTQVKSGAKPHYLENNPNGPHTDFLQVQGGDGIGDIYVSEFETVTGYQGFFISAAANEGTPYVKPNATLTIDNAYFRVLATRTVEPLIPGKLRCHMLIYPGTPPSGTNFHAVTASGVARAAAGNATYTPTVYMETLTGDISDLANEKTIQGSSLSFNATTKVITMGLTVVDGRTVFSDGSTGTDRNAKFILGAPPTPVVATSDMGDAVKITTAAALRAVMS